MLVLSLSLLVPPAARLAQAPAAPDAIEAAVGAPDRSADAPALDPARHPAETLAFFGIAPGQRVAELGSGGRKPVAHAT